MIPIHRPAFAFRHHPAQLVAKSFSANVPSSLTRRPLRRRAILEYDTQLHKLTTIGTLLKTQALPRIFFQKTVAHFGRLPRAGHHRPARLRSARQKFAPHALVTGFQPKWV